MTKFKTVIVLINYNSFNDTQECLISLGKINTEDSFVIVVDNSSTENVNLDSLRKFYPNIKILRNPINIGFGRANNVGIKWAQENLSFDYLLLLNNDTLVMPDTLENLIKPFEYDPLIGIVTGKIFYEKERNRIWYGGAEIDKQRGWPKIADYHRAPTPHGANKARFVTFISGCVMMFSQKCIEKVKGFDEDFFMYSEDLELSMRTAKLGFKMFYEPQSIIFHKVQGSFKNRNVFGFTKHNPNLPFLFYNMKLNQWISMYKHLSKKEFTIFSVFYWSELLYRLLIFIKWRRPDLIKTVFKINEEIRRYKLIKNQVN